MSQAWIIRSDMAPFDAKQVGLDISVCGHCAMRDGCYVNTFNAPHSVYKAYRAGRYQRIEPEALRGAAIRWAAYGDPAMLPAELVLACNAVARMWTGYTHQFKAPWAAWTRGVFMASVETADQEEKLRASGWGTFRAGLRDGSDRGDTELCASIRADATCIDCKRCDGMPRAIYIPGHGPRAQYVPAEQLKRRQSSRSPVAREGTLGRE